MTYVEPSEYVEIETPILDKWQQLEARLGGVFGDATATAGGHELRFVKRLDGERLVIAVYVDGWIKGEWSKADENGEPVHPEGWFWRPYRSRAWKLKQYPQLKRAFGKKKADQMTALKTVAYLPSWNTPGTLVRHLKKRFPDLELKEREGLS
jgi:hypothetical protein